MYTIPVNHGVEKVYGVRLVSTYGDDKVASKETIRNWAANFADFLYEVAPATFTEELTRRFGKLIAGEETPHEPVPTQE